MRKLAFGKTYSRAGTPDTDFGTLLHYGLEVYDDGLVQGLGPEDALASACEKLWIQAAGSGFDYPDRRDAGPRGPDNSRSPDTILRALIWYADQFKNDETLDVVQGPESGKAFNEARFELPFIDGVNFSGRVDKIALERSSGELVLGERKTTKAVVTKDIIKRWLPSNQIIGYVWAGRQAFGLTRNVVYYDICQTMVGGCRWARIPLEVEDWMIDEWLVFAKQRAAEIRDRADAPPPNFAVCSNYGGCGYHGACMTPPDLREQYLKETYAERISN